MAVGDTFKMGELNLYLASEPEQIHRHNQNPSSRCQKLYKDETHGYYNFDFVDHKDSSMAWEWVESTIDNKTCYVCTSGAFSTVSFDFLEKYINIHPYCYINKIKYKIVIPTFKQWCDFPTAVLNKIDFYNGTMYTYCSDFLGDYSATNPRITCYCYNRGSHYNMPINVQERSSSLIFIPVLIPITSALPDLDPVDIVKMGVLTRIDREDNSMIHYPQPSISKYSRINLTRYKQIVTFLDLSKTSYSEDDRYEWSWFKTNIDGKNIYISTTFITIFASLTSIIDSLGLVELKGKIYKLRFLSEPNWKRLHKNIICRIDFDRNYYDNNGSVETEALCTPTSTIDPNRRLFCGYDKYNDKFHFKDYIPYSHDFDPCERFGFLPVLEEIEYDIVKMGILKKVYFDNNYTIVQYINQPLYGTPIGNYISLTVGPQGHFTFEHTDNDAYKWNWIRTELNGRKLFISTVFADPSLAADYIVNNQHQVTIDGAKYKMVLLSIEEWESIDKGILNIIDFNIRHRHENGRIITDFYSTATNSFSTDTRNPQLKTREWFGGYDEQYNTMIRKKQPLINNSYCDESIKYETLGYLPVLELVNQDADYSDAALMGCPVYLTDKGQIVCDHDLKSGPINLGKGYMNFADTSCDDKKCRWLETFTNNKKVFVGVDVSITGTSYNHMLNNLDTCRLNNKDYKKRILSVDEWNLIGTNILDRVNFNNYYIPTSTVNSNGRTWLTYRDKNFYYKYIKDDNSINENCAMITVLEPMVTDTSISTVYMGNFQAAVNTTTFTSYKQLASANAISLPSYSKFTFKDTVMESLKWKWFKTTLNEQPVYITSTIPMKNITYDDIMGSLNTVTLNNQVYQLKLLTFNEWISLGTDLLSSIDFDLGNYSHTPFYVLTSNVVNNSRVWLYYNRDIRQNDINYPCFTDKLTPVSSNNSYIDAGYIPVLVLKDNSLPIISGVKGDLGVKSSAFQICYSVNDLDEYQDLTVEEKLNGKILNTIYKAVRNKTYTIDITNNLLRTACNNNSSNIIEVTVNDGINTVSETCIFTKTNYSPEIIYNGPEDLGYLKECPVITYTVKDQDIDDKLTVKERLNGKSLRSFTVDPDTEIESNITEDNWLNCYDTVNIFEIMVSDLYGNTAYKTITFTKNVSNIQLITKPILCTNMPTKISLELDWVVNNASGKVEVCNNAFDDNPTWEDITDNLELDTMYLFTNNTKIAPDWGISIKVTIEKDSGYRGEIDLYSIKGTYE